MASTIQELRRLAEQDKKKMIRLYNPDVKDFSVFYDDGSGRKEYTIKALEMEEFPYVIGGHVKKHLIDRILNKRGAGVSGNIPEAKRKIAKEIEVSIE